jgi:hypothetical protein
MNPIHLREMPESIPDKPLTVGEIIQILSQVDPNLPFFMEGYEDGITAVFRISQSEIVKDDQCWTGEYSETTIDSDGDREQFHLEGLPSQTAIVISFRDPGC